MFAGGFSQKCEEKDISYKDTVKDTNIKALHGIIPMPIDIMIDDYDCDQNLYYATILKFDTQKFSWRQMGNMTKARKSHGASVVNIEDVKKFCN